jgi:cobalt-zinc-cadmium efflux system membrane fusion protein
MKEYNKIAMKKYAWNFLLLVTITALAACTPTESSDSPESPGQEVDENLYELTSTQFTSSGMELGEVEMQAFHEIVKANGRFDVPPESQASVSTYFGGTVKNIQLLPGQRVKRGQVLFTLENPDYVQRQQEYLEAQGQLTYLKSDFERQQNLAEDNVASQKNFLKAESDYTVMSVKLASLSKQLTLMGIDPGSISLENIRTTINAISPISGYVTEVNITTGTFLNPSQPAVVIVNTDHLHLELNIFERDLSKVRVGQAIQFKLQEDDGKAYQASVHLVNKTVDTENRTIGIHGHLADEKLAARFNPGMYVEADIYTTSASRASLPQDALVEVEGKYYALVLVESSQEGYTFVKKEIKAGTSNNGYVEIQNTDDFEPKTAFLVKGAFNLITE